LVRQAGERVRHPRLSDSEAAQLVALYEQGLSQKTLRSSWAEAPMRYGISCVVKVSLGGTRNSWPASHTHDGCRCRERSATAGNDHAGHVSQGIRHQPVVGPLAALLTGQDAGVDEDLEVV
jgi:hypothetical protein